MTTASKTRRPWRDGGSATVSIAIIFPAIALTVLALAQTVMAATAHQVALAAAEEGLRIARAHHGTVAAGHAAALDFARHEPVLLTPQVTVASITTAVTVTVHGDAPTLLPGLHLTVSATAHGPREIFTTETRGFTNPGGSPGVSPRW